MLNYIYIFLITIFAQDCNICISSLICIKLEVFLDNKSAIQYYNVE